jgi:GNAT superfamily N-acetyltransferase
MDGGVGYSLPRPTILYEGDDLITAHERPLGRFDCSAGLVNILWQKDDLLVRNAHVNDLLFIDKLQKENSNAVGFIQRTIWDRYVFGGERNFFVLICEKNTDLVGYALITPGKSPNDYVKIQQIAVREDARRLDYGSALIHVIGDFCLSYGRMGARLRCRVDLQSNAFWQALGFTLVNVWKKGKINHVGFRASNDINVWQIQLNNNYMGLFDLSEMEVK